VSPDGYDADVLLADGGSAHVRLLRAGDEPLVRRLYHEASDRSRYLRFFSRVPVASAARDEQRAIGSDRTVSLVAEVEDRLVAMADYDLTDDAGTVAEVAFLVHDDWQGRGLGTILLEHLARVATARGVRSFQAAFLLENRAMRQVFRDAGFTISWAPTEYGVGAATLDLVPTEAWRQTAESREHTSEARSMARVLAPSSIAVVGAGRRNDSIGAAIVRNLTEGGFTGPVFPVNPHAASIGGLTAYPSVTAVPVAPDLVVIAVPAAAVADVVRECGARGTRAVVVISGGFAELPGGEAAQRELVTLARGEGMRLVGPNCVGVVNTHPDTRMNATFSPVRPERGGIGFASQSGGVGIELLARARALGLGISSFVSLGNKADVSPNDLLQYWGDDPETDVVLLYLESFGNPRKFARLADDLARRKPVIAMKSGRTQAGARGARSHTAALADLDSAVDELFRATGVVRVDTLQEMFDAAMVMAHQPIPAGRRVAIMSNGGGPGILAADACGAAGLEVPVLSETTRRALEATALPGASLQNPVDLIAAAGADAYRAAGRVLLESGEIDALMVLYVTPQVTSVDDVERAVVDIARGADGIPVVACFLGLDARVEPLAVTGTSRHVPTFEYPESAARALARAAWLGEWRRRPRGIPAEPRVDRDRARQRVADELGHRPDGGWLGFDVASAILADYGIPVVETRAAASGADAVAMAAEIGYPVALKAAAPRLVHKTDVGGVVLGLATADAVRAAFDGMRAALDDAMGGAFVQRMAESGVELIAGISHDPQFGALVVFGAGGTAAELQHDTTMRIPPLSDVDLDEMLRALRGSPLLFGYRNAPPVDTTALADVLARVGSLAVDIPEVVELDCNPLVARPEGVVVVDVKMRLAPDADPRRAFTLE
jgi:acetate---CoA ligase (ADP-forming)